MGYEFDIIYKPGAQNKQADALSRLYEDTLSLHYPLATSKPRPTILDSIRHYYEINKQATELLTFVQIDPLTQSEYTICDAVLYFKGRIYIPLDLALQHLLILEFHNTPTGGHASIKRTYHRITGTFFWPTL